MTSIFDFIKRHITWILVGVAACLGFLLIPGIPNELKVVLKIIVNSSVVLFIAMISLYALTPIKFTNFDFINDPNMTDIVKAAFIIGKYLVIGLVFIGLCILAAGTDFATYFVLLAPGGN